MASTLDPAWVRAPSDPVITAPQATRFAPERVPIGVKAWLCPCRHQTHSMSNDLTLAAAAAGLYFLTLLLCFFVTLLA